MEGVLKLNMDSSASGKPGRVASVGFLEMMRASCYVCWKSVGVLEPNTAEVLAINRALRFFCESQWLGSKKLVI